ncbi:MAG: iron-sulfur cluster-binding domain-containing protein [Firmicutes bacterium]|nr:iron-sulfur cluster-binding domain-containing protein [Bacillota bacterium]
MQKRSLEDDMAKMFAVIGERAERVASAEAFIDRHDPVFNLANNLHPSILHLQIATVRDESNLARTYQLTNNTPNAPLPPFRAGQYLVVRDNVDQGVASRPYTISSSPHRSNTFYEITISHKKDGFFSKHAWENWKEGMVIKAEGPFGYFYHEPLRDKNKLIALAGGSGITPFYSMIQDVIATNKTPHITLIYGSTSEHEIIFVEQLNQLAQANPENIKIFHVISDPSPGYKGLTGLISMELIKSIIDEPTDYSYFICGPEAMYRYCLSELALLNLPPRLIRKELSGNFKDVIKFHDYPSDIGGREVTIEYTFRTKEGKLKANTAETILTAFERAGLEPPAHCRSGECGFCRTLLQSGEIYVLKETDRRRAADLEYGYIHPCSTYPIGDLKVDII